MIRKYLTISFFIITFLSPIIHAQSYLWPTDVSHIMTSSFAEFRPGHFHAGIDISTYGQIGHPIFAIADGYIARLGVSPYGYGRVLYLKLQTGETAVYGHLSRFKPEIEEIVKREQKKHGRFRIQKYFSSTQLPVKAGEIIAYSGDTGVGVPHIHFEIRDSASRPTNPLLKGYLIDDTIPPLVTGVSFTPLDAFSMVDGDFKPLIVRPKALVRGQYRVVSPVIVSGNMGLGVDAFDQADGFSNRFGMYEIELYIDETFIFGTKYDRFSYDETREIVLDRDYRLEARGLGRFYKLYRDKGNDLSLYSCGKPLCGVLSYHAIDPLSRGIGREVVTTLPQGAHKFLIKLKDYFGNMTTVEGTLIASGRPKFNFYVFHDDNTDVMIGKISPLNIHSFAYADAEISLDDGRTWSALASVRKDVGNGWSVDAGTELSDDGFSFPIERHYLTRERAILKTTVQNLMGVDSYPQYEFFGTNEMLPRDELQFEVLEDFYDDYLRLQIETSAPVRGVPKLQYWNSNRDLKTTELFRTDLTQFVGAIPLNPDQSDPVILELSAKDLLERECYHREVLHIQPVPVHFKKQIFSNDGLCSIDFSTNSLYRDIYVRFSGQPFTNIDQLDIVTRIYTIEPKDVPMKGGVRVRLNYDPTDPDPARLGLYVLTETGQWRFVDNKLDPNLSAVSGKAKSFGSFALIRDVEAPTILSLRPADGANLRTRKPILKARFRDDLSGISGEENMVLKLDGVRKIAEWDPERISLFYRVEEPLDPGEHQVSLFLRDRSGNISQSTHTFWIN